MGKARNTKKEAKKMNKISEYFGFTPKDKILFDFTNCFFWVFLSGLIVSIIFFIVLFPSILGMFLFKLGMISGQKLTVLVWANGIYLLCMLGLVLNFLFAKHKRWL
jgi:hypothetical protein